MIQLHHFALHRFFAGLVGLVLVLVLDAHHLGLDFLHLAHRLHGLVEQRENTRLNHQHQEHDGHDPRETNRIHAQHDQELMEQGHDLSHEPLNRVQELVKPAPETAIEEELSLITHYRPFSLSFTARGVSRGSSCAFDHENL